MKALWLAFRPALTLALGLALAAPAAAAPSLPSSNVAWLSAGADADIERAFALARTERKPLLLYWGASWCPPCNQLKATFFNRQDFAALSRSFVAVHVDGDLPGAQKIGRRFKVSAYPTVLLLSPAGNEITRLPGEADAAQVMGVLQQGLSGGRSVKAVLAEAVAGQPLAASEWKLLAFYSWDTDEQQLLARPALPATLARLAAASPPADTETTTRLWLKALAASDQAQGAAKPDAPLRERVLRVLTDAAQARQQMDVLANSAAEIVRTLQPEPGAERAALVSAFDSALRRLHNDSTLSRGNRMDALYGRVQLARLDQPGDSRQPKLADALIQELRSHVQRDDREISDGYERQAVITAAAATLSLAGLWVESETLLKTNLAKSHSPYYLMSQLGSNARKQGRNDEALAWYGQAFERSVGPATRLQWGAGYVAALVDLAPADAARIEKTVSQLLAEAAKDPGAFEGRSVRSLQRVGSRLAAWNAEGKHVQTLRRLQSQLDGICPQVDVTEGQRAACQALFKPSGKKSA